MSLVNLDKSLGYLRSPISDEIIEYEPFEFSAHSLGIISPLDLEPGAFVIMDTHHSGRVPFNILGKAKDNQGLWRYRLTCPEKDLDLSKVLEIDPNSGRIKFERTGNNLQYARFILNPKIYVESKTFGSSDTYMLEGVDISRTGMLLCSPKPWGSIPFIENTLLEIKLDMGKRYCSQPLTPLGKVVRKFTEGMAEELSRYYAVRFVDFSPAEQASWADMMTLIESASENEGLSKIAA